MPLLHHSYEPEKKKLTYQHFPLTTVPINKSLIANFSGKETSFFFKISPKVVFCTTVPEYGHNSICQKTDSTTFVSQVFICPGPICLGPICPGPICLGPICPWTHLSRTHLSGTHLSWDPFVLGPICPGPICPGPICPGPICLGPICPGPICLGPICPRIPVNIAIKRKAIAEYESQGWDTGCDVINLQNHGRKKNFASWKMLGLKMLILENASAENSGTEKCRYWKMSEMENGCTQCCYGK